MENFPESLGDQREQIARCLEAMDRTHPFDEVYLFGSHARGEARPDSDVDLCIVAEGLWIDKLKPGTDTTVPCGTSGHARH